MAYTIVRSNIMCFSVSIVPDRLAHYRVSVFDNLARSGAANNIFVYGDLSPDFTGIRKPAIEDLNGLGFRFRMSKDIRFRGRLIVSSGSLKAAFDSSDLIVLWGDAFCPGNWVAVLVAKALRKKVVFWTHGLYGNEGLIKKKIRCLFYSFADSLLLYGLNSKYLLKSEGFSEDRLYVINNSLDFTSQNERYSRLVGRIEKGGPHSLKIIFVGRLTKVKSLHLILYAAKAIDGLFAISIDFVGDGDEAEKLKRVAVDCGLDGCVKFHGAVYDEDVLAELIMGADMMVSPGNVGLTAMHALVYGTPVISHSNALNQMPEFESIRPGVSGELFTENDIDSLTASILRCKKRLLDGVITEESCRKVLSDFYSPSYQRRVFNECVKKTVEIE